MKSALTEEVKERNAKLAAAKYEKDIAPMLKFEPKMQTQAFVMRAKSSSIYILHDMRTVYLDE